MYQTKEIQASPFFISLYDYFYSHIIYIMIHTYMQSHANHI